MKLLCYLQNSDDFEFQEVLPVTIVNVVSVEKELVDKAVSTSRLLENIQGLSETTERFYLQIILY
jgi:hypothetical protein